MKILQTVLLLLASNIFMNFAWYGHLKLFPEHNKTAIWLIILVSWGFAFFEYCFMIPANRLGADINGGPFSILQLKVVQEVITLLVFTFFSLVFFKVQFTYNHLIAFVLLVGAVYFMFKK